MAGNPVYNFKYVYNKVIEIGLKPLFTEYINGKQELKVECPKHGIFYIQLKDIHRVIRKKAGNCCSQCRIDNIRHKVDYVLKRFKELNLNPLFIEYVDLTTKLPYICNKHMDKGIQYTTYGVVKRRKTITPCKYCKSEYLSKLYTPKIQKEKIIRKRTYKGYAKWQKQIYEKHNYSCQICGCNSTPKNKLNAHHILNYKQYPELRLSIENGTCLCKKHHDMFHKLYGYKDNNSKQLETFLKNYKEV